jgi:hypothetical protein
VLAALIVVCAIVVGACSGSTNQGAPAAGSSGSSSLSVPLPPWDPEAFRQAEANLRRDGRAQTGLAQLGPGALELAALMDRTASFLLVQLPAKMQAAAPLGGSLALGRSSSSGSVGRLAAPLRDLPPPGAPIFGTYIITTLVFDDLIGRGRDTSPEAQAAVGEKCPCTKTATLDPTTDEVTVGGNKGTITTTTTVSATVNGSKVSLDIKLKVEGEVRDAVTGAVLYKIANEATGHADGDACPDASGVAHATMAFGGHEDYFDASGAKSGSGVSEGFSGELRIKADDNAKLAGVDITTTGQGGDLMIRLAADSAAPALEKDWRSGMCIAVLVDPEGGEVDKDSVTTVTAKVKHKIDGNELDKPVEATLNGGVKSIDPAGSKQKAPATFRYTAGSTDGDKGGVSFDSVSNRGIGHAFVTFTVAGGWTISSVGTSTELSDTVGNSTRNSLQVSLKDVKVSAGTDNALSGSGTIAFSGPFSSGLSGVLKCTSQVDRTFPVTVTGSLAGTGPDAVLKLTLHAPSPPGEMLTLTCTDDDGAISTIALPYTGEGDRYGFALGELDLPAAGGTKSIDRSVTVDPVTVRATATVTVVRGGH